MIMSHHSTYYIYQCKKIGNIFTVRKLLLNPTAISDIFMSFIPNKTTYTKDWLTQWIFKVPWELWSPLSMAVPTKFQGSGGHSKRNCLPDRANYYRSWAWQIVLIFNTAHTHTHTHTYIYIYIYNKDTAILCNHQFSISVPLSYTFYL